ncbi:group I truncated hemoglobin [Solicola gregarius]|uniref:Group 1 truncated hemoglobin n=1 Tax=Solicola gregarius TaxID=2908642 RepID=A0AA46TLU2_9ACTN|nr:group 1 truncated hemoglobin [Solicola gregarius]UYM07430.1 group 1 truncated hemoglobin [Solicola gregarius]
MSDDATRPETGDSDYSRIGGGRAVSAVVDRFYDLILDDPDLSGYFANTRMEHLKRHQVKLVSHLLGGPVEYDGRDLRTAHTGMDIGEADFDRVVTHLVSALSEAGVPDDVIGRLGGTLGAAKADIVSAS